MRFCQGWLCQRGSNSCPGHRAPALLGELLSQAGSFPASQSAGHQPLLAVLQLPCTVTRAIRDVYLSKLSSVQKQNRAGL